MKECRLYEKLKNGIVQCRTCSHHCVLRSGQSGICRVRINRSGTLYSLVFGKAVALHVDPIEKKPLFHFYPGTLSFSMATAGCNMKCLNCQNSDISQIPENGDIGGRQIDPEQIVHAAQHHKCHSVAYTYTKPAVYWDYAYETARRAHEKGIKNIFVTNGYLSELALKEISPYLHAANVDIKAYRDKTYQELCGARLKPVLDTVSRMVDLGIWVEVTTLLIPGINDSEEELRDIAGFIQSTDPGIPWHISRFHPAYRMSDHEVTPVSSIHKALSIGKEAGLRYIYAGNIPGDDFESTHCYECNALLIHRWGFQVMSNRLEKGACPECGSAQDGIWTKKRRPI